MVKPPGDVISQFVVLRADLPDYWDKFLLADNEHKLPKQAQHCWIFWFLITDDISHWIIVSEDLNDLTSPHWSPKPARDNYHPKLQEVDWLTKKMS